MAFLNTGCNSGCCNTSLARHICEYIGETVTIFTTSGGVSGCGFTGVVLSVNACFVRLITEQGTAPSNPLAENICGDFEGRNGGKGCGFDGIGGAGMGNGGHRRDDFRRLGSVCDIPIENIAAFCHNAV